MQSLLNIVNNAKDSILKKRESDKKFKGKIDINISNYLNYAQIEISDNGGGIDEKNMKSSQFICPKTH